MTVGGLETSEYYREAAALQLMLTAAYWGDVELLREKTARQAWFLEPNKTALRRRGAQELEPVGEERFKVGAEMRILGLTDFWVSYRGLYVLPYLALMAGEHQRKLAGLPYVPQLAEEWESLVGEINGLFEDFRLRPVEEIWSFKDLEKLAGVLKGKRRENFVRRAREVLETWRLKVSNILKDDEVFASLKERQERERREGVSGLEEKGLAALEETVRRWSQDDEGVQEGERERQRRMRARDLKIRRMVLFSALSDLAVRVLLFPSESLEHLKSSLGGIAFYLLLNPEVIANLKKVFQAAVRERRFLVDSVWVRWDLSSFRIIGPPLLALHWFASAVLRWGESLEKDRFWTVSLLMALLWLGTKQVEKHFFPEKIEQYDLEE